MDETSETGPAAAATTAPAEATAGTSDRDALAAFLVTLREVTPRVRVVPALVAINLAVFTLMVATGVSVLAPEPEALLRWGANYGPRSLAGQPWRMLASAFLHFGVMHLAFNMYALVSAGRMIERMFGPVRFLVLYLVAALTGSVLSVLLQPQVVSAGASGAIFGVYGALGGFLLRQHGAIPAAALKSLSKVALVFVGYNLVFGFTHQGVDNAAHVGGLLGGLLCGVLLARPLTPRAEGRLPASRRPLDLLLGAVSLALAIAVLVPTPPDTLGALTAFFGVEGPAVIGFNRLVEQVRREEITDRQFAEQLDQVILPRWHTARMQLAAVGRWPRYQENMVADLLRYAELRESSWTMFARALRAADEAKAKEAMALQQEADVIIKRLNDKH